jgi:hypothetical protein
MKSQNLKFREGTANTTIEISSRLARPIMEYEL